jgi:hypothetical protein
MKMLSKKPKMSRYMINWNACMHLFLSPEARKMTWTAEIGKIFLGRPKKMQRCLPDIIGCAIAVYQHNKDVSPRLRFESASELLDLIQRARAFRVIRNPKQQARAYEQEIEQLKEQINSLTDLNKKLALENKRLHNLVDNRGDTQVGDVE